jgi:hypothetical protein
VFRQAGAGDRRDGIIRLDAVGTQQWQIVSDDKVLELLSSL